MRIENTKAVVDKLFGKTHEEVCKQLNLPQLNEYAQKYPFGVHVTPLNELRGYKVVIGFKGYVHLIAFNLEYYPSCCGTRLFHTFSVDEYRVTQGQLDEIMTTFLRENMYGVKESSEYLGRANRIEVMMVESRCETHRNLDIMQDIEPIENPCIQYKPLWNFFHKHAKRVRTRLELNPNTGNVLHNMEVIF